MSRRLVTPAVRALAPLLLVFFGAPAQAQGAPAAAAEPGRDLYAAHCSRCHGSDATGTASGPNLRQRVKGMSEDAFGAAVLQRYRFSVPASEAGGESAAREAMMRGALTRREDSADMPAWQSQPAVAAGIRNLYAFLAAKSR
jgi:mono/diheme cytochrome c family protein